jgi:hypothetical protein
MRALALALFISSCGYGPSLSVACQDVASERCGLRDRCTGGTSITSLFGDSSTCLVREHLACMLLAQAPSVGEQPLDVERCAVAYGSLSCEDFFASKIPSGCPAVGPRAMGERCAYGAQCASGYCGNDKTANCGQCAPPPQAGSPCVNSVCGSGLQCASRTLACADIPTLGMPCDPNAEPCAVHLTCINLGVSGGPFTCNQGIATLGAACGGTLGGCDSSIGLTCAGISVTTRACRVMEYRKSGEVCGALETGTFANCASGLCFTSVGVARLGEMGTCKAGASEGEACDAVTGPGCLYPARCVVGASGSAGTCALPVPSSCG